MMRPAAPSWDLAERSRVVAGLRPTATRIDPVIHRSRTAPDPSRVRSSVWGAFPIIRGDFCRFAFRRQNEHPQKCRFRRRKRDTLARMTFVRRSEFGWGRRSMTTRPPARSRPPGDGRCTTVAAPHVEEGIWRCGIARTGAAARDRRRPPATSTEDRSRGRCRCLRGRWSGSGGTGGVEPRREGERDYDIRRPERPGRPQEVTPESTALVTQMRRPTRRPSITEVPHRRVRLPTRSDRRSVDVTWGSRRGA